MRSDNWINLLNITKPFPNKHHGDVSSILQAQVRRNAPLLSGLGYLPEECLVKYISGLLNFERSDTMHTAARCLLPDENVLCSIIPDACTNSDLVTWLTWLTLLTSLIRLIWLTGLTS